MFYIHYNCQMLFETQFLIQFLSNVKSWFQTFNFDQCSHQSMHLLMIQVIHLLLEALDFGLTTLELLQCNYF
jgi:hypothetical protein